MKVVVTRPIPSDGFSLLEDHEVIVLEFESHGPTEDELVDAARDADGLITLLSDPVTARVLEGCSNLKVIAQFAVGYDNIDVEAARRQGIVVTNTPDVLTDATADFAFALLLAVARRIKPADQYVRDGRFTRWEAGLLLGRDLRGKTLGIIGMGRIGSATARRAIGFGMRVIYHNRTRANPTTERVLGARYVSMDTLLRESDAISLHCNLTRETHHLIDAHALEMMKPDAILVNTARGPVVREDALVSALRARTIGGAGLDVFEHEPRVHPGLVDLENVVLAPHLGSATLETRTKMSHMCAEAISAVFSGASDVPYRVA